MICFVENVFCFGKEEECEDIMNINEKNLGFWNKLISIYYDSRFDIFNVFLENLFFLKCLFCDFYRGNMNINLYNMMYWWDIKGRVFYKFGLVNWWVIGIIYRNMGD